MDLNSRLQTREATGGKVMERLLYRPEEAADVLGLGRSSVYALLRSGELPSILSGRSRRITPEALQKFIASRIAEAR